MPSWLLDSLQKWTPFSVMILLITVLFCGITGWYAFHFQAPPGYVIAVISAIGGIGTVTQSISHGVNIANGVAKDTATAVIQEQAKQNSGGLNNGQH